jgi:hypothetical protein
MLRNRKSRAKDALKWAARTYVVAALGSIATHYVSIYMGGSRRVEKKEYLKAIPNLNL